MCYADEQPESDMMSPQIEWTKEQPSNINFHMSSLSTDDNTMFTPMPSISKNTSNAKNLKNERAKDVLLQAILRKKTLLRVKIRRQMQRKLVRLWNACTKYEDSRALNSKEREKKNSDLLNHVQDCCDIDCKELFCQSSRRIIVPLSKCCKTLNQHSIRNSSAPAMDHCIKESRGGHQLRKVHDSEISIGKTKGMDGTLIYDSAENKTSTSYTLEHISGVSQSSHTTAGCVDHNTFRNKQLRNLSHLEKNSVSGPGGDLKVQLFSQKPKPVEHTQNCIEKPAMDVMPLNPNLLLDKLQTETSLSCTDIAFECLSEEEKKERSDVLIALLSLKKKVPNCP